MLLLLGLALAVGSYGQETFFEPKYEYAPWRYVVTPVEVAVYYEAKCPDSRNFILNQLVPAYAKGRQLMTLAFIPYGKAQTVQTSTGYEFTCQHGPSECEGNKIHACAIQHIPPTEILLRYIACMMKNYAYPESIGEKCAAPLGVDWNEILHCSRGARGSYLLKAYGDLTGGLNPPVSFIPTITLNGSQGNQTAILNDLWGEVCKTFGASKPPQCVSWYSTAF